MCSVWHTFIRQRVIQLCGCYTVILNVFHNQKMKPSRENTQIRNVWSRFMLFLLIHWQSVTQGGTTLQPGVYLCVCCVCVKMHVPGRPPEELLSEIWQWRVCACCHRCSFRHFCPHTSPDPIYGFPIRPPVRQAKHQLKGHVSPQN